jgi:transcriptional regulator with XRE-family HTH domain
MGMARLALTGTRIRDRRLLLGQKQADLARKVGISPAYLNLIEHNRRRVGAELLVTLAEVLGVDATALAEGAEGALFDALREAGALGAVGIAPEVERLEEFVGRFPGWAALLAARQGQVARLSRNIESFSERMAQDPYLADSLHEVLSAITSLRSSSTILAETPDIEPEWRDRFLHNIHDDSLRLTTASVGLVAYLDQTRAPETGLASPQEEVEGWLASTGYHFAALERATAPEPESLIEAQVELASAAARALALAHLRAYRADARALPLAEFTDALAEHGADPMRLAHAMSQPLPLIMRRLASLPEAMTPPGLGLIGCDASGTMTYRRPSPGFALPRFGAACPLWPLYEALVRPTTPICRMIEVAGRDANTRFIAYAWCDRDFPGGFDGPAVSRSLMLLLAAGQGAGPGAMPNADQPLRVGPACRICPEQGCVARREPSILG